MAAAQDKVAQAIERTSQSFSEQIKKRTNLEGLGTAVRSQATAWEEVAKSVTDATKAGVKSGTINKTVDSTK
jgi:hypothetical protein